MQLRMLNADDAEQFQSLRLRALAECPAAFASSYEEEAFESREIVSQRLNPSGQRAIFGAFVGNALVGVLGLQREGMKKLAHKAYMWGMYVAPEHRRAGVGELLVRQVLQHAHALGVRQVNLGVNITNVAALKLYKKLGFTTFGLERGFLLHDGKFYDEYQMVCVLPGAADVEWATPVGRRSCQSLESMECLAELEQHLLSLEERLLEPTTRKDAATLEVLLGDDFVEFGSSGRVLDKRSIVVALTSEAPFLHAISDFKLVALAEDAAFVTYRLTLRAAPNAVPTDSLRSSVWQRVRGEWKMVFHQGTRAAEAQHAF